MELNLKKGDTVMYYGDEAIIEKVIDSDNFVISFPGMISHLIVNKDVLGLPETDKYTKDLEPHVSDPEVKKSTNPVNKFNVGDYVIYLENKAFVTDVRFDMMGNALYNITVCYNDKSGSFLSNVAENILSPYPDKGIYPKAMSAFYDRANPNILLYDLEETFHKCLDIAKKKNADYAGNNDPFKNFRGSEHVKVSPDRAILVRMMDKISRVSNLIDTDAMVKDESIDDTLNDIINYAAILKSYIKRK